MKVLASDSKMVQMTVNDGKVLNRSKDGTFSVPDRLGRSLLKGSEFGRVGVNLRTATGWRCGQCGHLGVFRDRCGKCGGPDLLEED